MLSNWIINIDVWLTKNIFLKKTVIGSSPTPYPGRIAIQLNEEDKGLLLNLHEAVETNHTDIVRLMKQLEGRMNLQASQVTVELNNIKSLQTNGIDLDA